MSEQQQSPEHATEQPGVDSSMSSPSLSEAEALRAREEARQSQSQAQTGEAMAGGRGRVEEETRRLSERMTREEQERRKALALTQTAPLIPTPAPTPTPTPSRQAPEPLQIRTTLVALDGSPFAERALPYAVALAHLTGSAITLGTAARRVNDAAQSAEAIEDITSASPDSSERSPRQSLLAARSRLATEGVTTRANMVYGADVAEGLLLLGEQIGAEALALATHARSGIERIVLGSVADEVVRRGHGLTLVTPPLAPDASLDGASFARALAPLDGSALSEQALRVIQPLLQRDPAGGDERRWLRALTLLFVAEAQAQVRDAEVYLHDLRDMLQHVATAPTEITAQVVIGSAPGAIVARATGAHPTSPMQDERHDLIIMATHGRGGPERWFYGSVATYVLAHSTVPVLLVRTQP